ncbi:MAG: WecB/TagA/CpsF family glycosyltransferase [Acidobacteriaceae bacterium]|nr:WecB/TagA/CpsF family glycosyltransferase [Acidobacteriaceae bacterium]
MSETALDLDTSVASFKVLAVQVSAVQIPEVVLRMRRWIGARRRAHYIAVTGMHGVMEARRDSRFERILNSADLVVPDGMPLVWLGRWHGHALARRVYGPELMEKFCRETGNEFTHFFYGGAPGTGKRLGEALGQRFGTRSVGDYSPPFRPLTADEDAEVVKMIEEAAPDILWIGLSTPKQERWMYEHRERLTVPVIVGVGAAFDFHTGQLKQAPSWMRENGLEWLYRLIAEPRRLWRRYLVYGPQFVWNVLLQICKIRRFSVERERTTDI